jgi:hypothetical protein
MGGAKATVPVTKVPDRFDSQVIIGKEALPEPRNLEPTLHFLYTLNINFNIDIYILIDYINHRGNSSKMGEQNRIYSFSKIRIPQSEIRNQIGGFYAADPNRQATACFGLSATRDRE